MVSHRRWASQGQRWAAGGRRALRAPLAAGLVARQGARGGAAVDGGVDVGEGEGRESGEKSEHVGKIGGAGLELEGAVCGVCGWGKRAGHPLCWNCWCDLLPYLKVAVKAGEFAGAVQWLVGRREQRVRLGQCVECGLKAGHLERCPAKVAA